MPDDSICVAGTFPTRRAQAAMHSHMHYCFSVVLFARSECVPGGAQESRNSQHVHCHLLVNVALKPVNCSSSVHDENSPQRSLQRLPAVAPNGGGHFPAQGHRAPGPLAHMESHHKRHGGQLPRLSGWIRGCLSPTICGQLRHQVHSQFRTHTQVAKRWAHRLGGSCKNRTVGCG